MEYAAYIDITIAIMQVFIYRYACMHVFIFIQHACLYDTSVLRTRSTYIIFLWGSYNMMKLPLATHEAALRIYKDLIVI